MAESNLIHASLDIDGLPDSPRLSSLEAALWLGRASFAAFLLSHLPASVPREQSQLLWIAVLHKHP